MKYFASLIRQYSKEGERVCGDCVRCLRTGSATYMVLCDGIGSGIYANIAAITCAERLCQLFRSGRGFRSACATVADSMHRAHSENIPYSAFTAVKIFFKRGTNFVPLFCFGHNMVLIPMYSVKSAFRLFKEEYYGRLL